MNLFIVMKLISWKVSVCQFWNQKVPFFTGRPMDIQKFVPSEAFTVIDHHYRWTVLSNNQKYVPKNSTSLQHYDFEGMHYSLVKARMIK